MTILNHDLRVSGALAAGNIATGSLPITPTPNTPTPGTVTGVNLAGAGTVHGFATPNTIVPGQRVQEVTVNNVSPQGMTIWLCRNNATTTTVRWMLARKKDA